MKNKFDKISIPELITKIGNSRYWQLPKMLESVLNRLTNSSSESFWKKSDIDSSYIENKDSIGIFSRGNKGTLNDSANRNTAVGLYSLNSITNGNHNTSVGDESSYRITSGSYNTSLGSLSLKNTTTGQQNIAIGAYSLSNNVSGNYNTSIGTSSSTNTTGSYNTATGNSSSYNLTSGSRNTGLGALSLQGRTEPITGNDNIAIGFQSLRSVSTGSRNIEISCPTNDNITTGSSNININTLSGINIGTGSNNLVIGGLNNAQSGITTGTNENIAIGVNGKIRWRVTTDGNHGINTATPNQSAVFHLNSNNKGFLPPVLTTTQKLAITSPAEGLLVYDSTLKTISVFDGTNWKNLQ